MGPVLELQGISKRFGRLAVLRHIDLALRPGEVLGLIGANGAGKTTLMSIIAGLLPPSDGTRRYWGEVVTELGLAHRARLAVVSHTAQVYARLTARENLVLYLQLCGASDRGNVVAESLERLGLASAIDRLAGTFSRGMLQRLALARAVLARPELFLLDEPFTALDRPGRALLRDVLLEERERGAALFLSSHDFDAIADVADRVILLEEGRIAGEVARRDDPALFRERLHEIAGHMPTPPRHGAEVHRVG